MNKIAITFLLIFSFLFSSNIIAQNKNDSLPSFSSKREKFEEKFYEAIKQKGIENFSRAVKILNECLEFYPNSAVIYYELGDVYLKIKNFDKSEYNLKKAIAIENKNFWFKEKLFKLYLIQENFDKAIKALIEVLKYRPYYKADLANIYIKAGRYIEALNYIQLMDDRYGYSSERDRKRIKIYKITSDQDGHINFLKYRFETEPKNHNYFIDLIYALSEYGLESEAFNTAKKFLKHNPSSHIAHVALYKFYLKQKDYENAISSMKIVTGSNVLLPVMKLRVLQDFIDFVRINPSYNYALLSIESTNSLDDSNLSNEKWGSYYFENNQFQKALDYYEKAFEESSQDVNIIKKLAQLYLKTNQYQKALEFSLEYLEIFPTQIELYLICGKSQFYFQNWNDAIEVLEQGFDYIYEENNITMEYYELMVDLYTKNKNPEKVKEISYMIELIKSQ